MKSLYQQQKEIFNRHADIADGKYISYEKVTQLLGKAALQYAINAVKGYYNIAEYRNVHGKTSVLTFSGFSRAFDYFWTMEIKKGLHSAFEVPDYLARPEFMNNIIKSKESSK